MRRSTIVFLLLLVILAGVYYYLNNREQPADIELTVEPESEVAYLFRAEEGLPSSIRVEAKTGEEVEIARGADDAWTVIAPREAAADQAAAGAAASQVSTLRILDTVPDVDPEIVGLTDPEYIVTVRFSSGGERKAEIGVITPTENGYYVRDEDGEILIISKSAIDSLIGLLTNPPYVETLTPSLSPEESTTPTP
jgi:hypothetical protein